MFVFIINLPSVGQMRTMDGSEVMEYLNCHFDFGVAHWTVSHSQSPTTLSESQQEEDRTF